MHIALFGGSGRTGAAFVPKALEAGHTVKLQARSPEKVAYSDAGLTVVKGDVLDAANVAAMVAGADAVVSLLGHTKGGSNQVQTVGTRYIVRAMREHGVRRLISMSGGGLPYAKDEPKLVDKAFRGVMGLLFKDVIRDAKGHADVLQRSDLDWTVVRAPRLVSEPDRGEYKVGYVGTTGGSKISRGDVADFILQVLEEGSHQRDMPFISW